MDINRKLLLTSSSCSCICSCIKEWGIRMRATLRPQCWWCWCWLERFPSLERWETVTQWALCLAVLPASHCSRHQRFLACSHRTERLCWELIWNFNVPNVQTRDSIICIACTPLWNLFLNAVNKYTEPPHQWKMKKVDWCVPVKQGVQYS